MRNTTSTAACTLSWPWRGAILITYRVADDATRYFSRRNIYCVANIVILWHIAGKTCATANREEISKTPSFVAVNYRDTRRQDARCLRNNEAVCNILIEYARIRRGRNSVQEQTLPWTWRRGQIADCCISELDTYSRTSIGNAIYCFSACFIQRYELTYRNATRFARCPPSAITERECSLAR